MDIRSEAPGDASAIAAVTTAAFAEVPYASGTEAAIVAALRSAGALAVSLVAVEGGALVGHVAFSPVTITGAHGGWYGLGPISVRPDRQRLGIGGRLVREGLRRLEAMQAAGCVVLGDPAYYGRFGFVSDPALTYGGKPSPFFQSRPVSGPSAHGDVAYHPAFGA